MAYDHTMEVPRRSGRRAVIPPAMKAELDELSPAERLRRGREYLDEHGEDVEPADGWTPYGPAVDDRRQADGHS